MRAIRFVALLACLALAAPAAAQDADAILSAILKVRSKIIPNARSVAALGAQREGTGILIREDYVLTIGYLVIEAETVEVSNAAGRTVPAAVAGYDHASGFGLLRLLVPLDGTPLPLGNSSALVEHDPVMIAAHGGRDGMGVARVVSRRPFSGSWEYLLDSAIFTYPPVTNWSGAALIGRQGNLLGVGSLIVPDAASPGTQSPGNMFVPIDLLKPILEDLIDTGRAAGPVQPWLGVNAEEHRGRLFVARVSPDGPAERAGLEPGDILVGVGDEEVSSLADFYRKVWSRGAAGVEVPLRVLQGTQVRDISVRSMDRLDYFRHRASY
ncbi:MAG: S1C family serine protease [Burkholderiales bacterium]